MKEEKDIRERVIYLEGYVAGQRNSHAPYDKEIENALIEINALNWVLDYTKDIECNEECE